MKNLHKSFGFDNSSDGDLYQEIPDVHAALCAGT